MASSIFFDGRVISVPGSYSRVDASGLETVGLGASGIVAVLGTAEGGTPVSDIEEFDDIPAFVTPEKMNAAFRDGQLREVADMLFAPSKDPDILAGAQQVLALKTNPSTQSAGSLVSGSDDQIDLTSVDYGAFTEQVNVELADGTSQGKMITIRFEDTVEVGDNVGGDTLATLTYNGGTDGYQTATLTIASGNTTVNAERSSLGKTDERTTTATNAKAEVLSNNIADTTQTVTIYGLVGGVATTETLALNGTNVVQGAVTWDLNGVLGVVMSAVAAGTVTVRTFGGAGVNLYIMTAGQTSRGIINCTYCFVNQDSVSVVLDGVGANKIIIVGKNAAGGTLKEAITLNGAVAVVSAGDDYAQIDLIAAGEVSNARTLTLSAVAAATLATVQKTLQKVVDYYNSKHFTIAGPLDRGFLAEFGSGKTTTPVTDFDDMTDVDILNPADAEITKDLVAIVEWINQNSQLVSAELSAGATTVPDNTTTPLFLSGGIEGVALTSHYQTALNLLKRGRVNSIVDLSGNPAVAAMVDAHCAYMCGIGRSERDGFIGLLNAGMTDVGSKTEIKSQIVDMNSRHIRAWGQAIERFSNIDGERTEYLPPYGAAILAGMQAGSPVGTSLTFKTMNILSLRQHSSWNPTDDAEEMIQAGLVFAENISGLGRRIVRNITTHLATNNLAFIEGSVNNAVNFAVFEFRTGMEVAVGKRGFAGTLAATRSVAVGKLGLLVDNTVITAYRALTLELFTDVLDVSVELAPVIPINFVRTTVHLVTIAQAA